MSIKRRKNYKEKDLYDPLYKWLINEGYTVQAEVKDCDVVAIKNDELTIIELKKSMSLQLIYQCMERQKIAPLVYAAIPTPLKGKRNKNLARAKVLLKKLGIGLILIHLYTSHSVIEKYLEAVPISGRKNARKKRGVINEIENRSGDYNVGGTQGKIISAYREAAIHVYYLLHKNIEASPAEIVKMGGPRNASNILRDNHYQWFFKIKRGVYTFDIDYEQIQAEYAEVLEHLENKYQ